MTPVSEKDKNKKTESRPALLHVAPSPHLTNNAMTTRRMMVDVIIGLFPVISMSVYVFKAYAVKQIGICLISCLAAEALLIKMRKKSLSLPDFSAVVTALILALSLPGSAPWYVGVIGSFAAIGVGKIVFGGLGMNIFNPAMVGRAFVMIAFAGAMAASGYEMSHGIVDIMSQATPMDAFKQNGVVSSLPSLFFGFTNGSLGEISALACLMGGLYLCIRRTASWEIPAGVILSVLVIGGIENLVSPETGWTVLHHLFGGALLFGAFYIATDPVTSPVTSGGKWIFGLGVGVLVMILRLFSGYPEGVMFAVLIMNAVTPLINQRSIPEPFGGV